MLHSVRQVIHSTSNLSGMRFSRECALYFWIGWLAWACAALALTFGEYALRVPDPPRAYLWEAGVAMLSWLIALAAADSVAISNYQSAWFTLQRRGLAPVLLDQSTVDIIRSELRTTPLLSWLRPPKSRSVRAQLLSAALWFSAVTQPEGAPWLKRYGEWLADVVAGYLLCGCALAIAMLIPTWFVLGLCALGFGCGLAVLGLSAIRLAARRQAILDFFTAWCSLPQARTPPTAHDDGKAGDGT